MIIETTATGNLLIFAIMALVTLATRFGGVFLMSFIRINPRIESFINTMASSVLIAIIVPQAVAGDWGARVALLVTSVLMLLWQRPLPAIGMGVLSAAGFRLFL